MSNCVQHLLFNDKVHLFLLTGEDEDTKKTKQKLAIDGQASTLVEEQESSNISSKDFLASFCIFHLFWLVLI